MANLLRPHLQRAGVALAVTALLLQACATPGRAVQQTVRVETPGCPQAQCSLSNDSGSWELPATPGTVTVTSSHSPLRVACRSADGTQGQAGAASALGASGHGGVVVGGVVGTGVGVAVAAPTAVLLMPALGAVIVAVGALAGATSGQAVDSQRRDIRYPELVTVPMNCGPTVDAGPGSVRAAMGFGVRGLTMAQRLATGAGEAAAVQVTDVAAGGAAARAGLKPGDLVLAARGQPLADAGALQSLVQALAAGEALALRVWREGARLDLVLVQPADPP